MKTIAMLFSLLLGSALYAQEDVVKRMEAAGVTIEQIENSLKDGDSKHYFKSTSTSTSHAEGREDYTSVQISEFDPRREIGERWKLLSMNGEEPTEEAKKSFNKTANSTKEVNGKIDLSTLRIVSENDQELVVTFRYNKKTLPKKYKFLKDCEATYTISKSEGRLKHAVIENLKPTKLGIIKVTRLKLNMEFIFLDEVDGYHISSEEMEMQAKFLGIGVTGSDSIQYTDFKLVK